MGSTRASLSISLVTSPWKTRMDSRSQSWRAAPRVEYSLPLAVGAVGAVGTSGCETSRDHIRRKPTSSDIIVQSSAVTVEEESLRDESLAISDSEVASHIVSKPLRNKWQSCSARHHVRLRYVPKSHRSPVSKCSTVGATMTNSEARGSRLKGIGRRVGWSLR